MTAPIDLTELYYNEAHMRGGIVPWLLNRANVPVEGIIIHHTAGWYGPRLYANSSRDAEVRQLDAMAADHFERFGIGPGYHYAVFPSGRSYAIGKYGTHRAHTKGRRPTRDPLPLGSDARFGLLNPRYNNIALGLVVFGDYEREQSPVTAGGNVQAGIRSVLKDVARYVSGNLWLGVHGMMRTVTKDGTPMAQTTLCPGKHLRKELEVWGLWRPTTNGHVPLSLTTPLGEEHDDAEWLRKVMNDPRLNLLALTNAAFNRGTAAGFAKGYNLALDNAHRLSSRAAEDIRRLEVPKAR
ncbi:hypothetical protein LCGC14_1547460 [marine sediment metagenome]|uniref:N-acetylmuramoyl-L-alanine amidase domain-containing protein n=1 Tax=marine sediment metagenome TaxID=412755 RepID=A0A0F9JC93_9ZZZZ